LTWINLHRPAAQADNAAFQSRFRPANQQRRARLRDQELALARDMMTLVEMREYGRYPGE